MNVEESNDNESDDDGGERATQRACAATRCGRHVVEQLDCAGESPVNGLTQKNT